MKQLSPYERWSRRGSGRTPLPSFPPAPSALTGYVKLGAEPIDTGLIASIPGSSPVSMGAAIAVNWMISIGVLYLVQRAGWTSEKDRLKAALLMGSAMTLANNILIPLATGVVK